MSVDPIEEIARGAGVPVDSLDAAYTSATAPPPSILYIPGVDDPPEEEKPPADVRALDQRLKANLIRRAFKFGEVGSWDTNSFETGNVDQYNEERVNSETPQIDDSEPLAPTSREINTDGRSVSTFFDEFARETEQDPVSYPIPDQVVGPPMYMSQKGAFVSDARNPEETPGTLSTQDGPSPSPRDNLAGWARFDGEDELNRGHFLHSNLSQSKIGAAGIHAFSRDQRSVIKNAAAALPKNSAAPNKGYRRRVDVVIHDGKGNVLVSKTPQGSYMFPGGGLDSGESINRAAQREALEEVAWATERPRAIPGTRSYTNVWTPKQRRDNAKKDRHYIGDKTYRRVAKAKKKDMSLYGADGDTMRARFVPIEKAIAVLESSAKKDHPYAAYDRKNSEALKHVSDIVKDKEIIEKAAAAVLRRKSAGDHGEGLFTPKDQLNSAPYEVQPRGVGRKRPASEEADTAENNTWSIRQIWSEADSPEIFSPSNYEAGGPV